MYTETAATGKFSTLARQGLACRLMHIPLQRAQNQNDRRELAALRNLIWDPDVVLPETCQIEVDGVRWGLRAGTLVVWRDWNGNVTYRSADAFRQEVSAF